MIPHRTLAVVVALASTGPWGCLKPRDVFPKVRAEAPGDPWSWETRPDAGVELPPLVKRPPVAPASTGSLTERAIRFYQDHMRRPRVEGGCVFKPSCSNYTMQALRRHGPLVGLVLALDRMVVRENRHPGPYPLVKVGDRILFYDPVP